MNGGGVDGGARAADDAGKPGAPEDTVRVGVGPEVEGEGQRALPQALVEGDHVTILTAPTRIHPLLTPAPQTSRQLRRHLLAGAQGLCRNHWLWGKGGEWCVQFACSDHSTDKGNRYVHSVHTRVQCTIEAERVLHSP